MSPPELLEDVALRLLADLQRHQREGAHMSIDPGRTTRQVQPHPGDAAAARIRAALDRCRGGQGGSTLEPQDAEATR